jgi:hypothetical protein
LEQLGKGGSAGSGDEPGGWSGQGSKPCQQAVRVLGSGREAGRGREGKRQFQRKRPIKFEFTDMTAPDEELVGRNSNKLRQDGCIL